jgi:multiple sugar transport system permease protein
MREAEGEMPKRKAAAPSIARAKSYAIGYLFISPMIIASIAFIFAPMAASLWWSFTDYNGIAPPRFVGLANYSRLIQDSRFLASLGNTSLYVGLGMLVGPALGLATAMLLNRDLRLKGLFRTAYFLPVMTSSVVVAMVWRLLYNQRGILNIALAALGSEPVGWLSDPRYTMLSIAAAGIWQGFGFETVVFLAALQSIPKDLYEAATLDGAGSRAKFANVTLPALKPVFFFVYCIGIIGSFQVFDLPYTIMSSQPKPGPEYTTLVYYLFSKFRSLNLGYASAIAYLLFVILLAVSLIQWRFGKRTEAA